MIIHEIPFILINSARGPCRIKETIFILYTTYLFSRSNTFGFTQFPGTMEWKLEWVECSDGYLGREILFTFLWDKDDDFNLWLENNGISIEEESLSFIIVCNFMSIEIGDDDLAYENTYNTAIPIKE